ncbi:TIGR01777 family protein [Planctomycetales bacterium ZRK34]|nr:TIGR01777 family protein [Planctomycetales bacterium ZRK34]
MKIAITGSTGLIGRAVVARLRDEMNTIVRIVRKPVSAVSETHSIHWLPSQGTIQEQKLSGVEAVIHLAGENIAGRWTSDKKQRIRDTRVRGTKILVDAIKHVPNGPKVLISASAVGYYGDRGDQTLTEDDGPGEGFLADVCKDWEAEALAAEEAGVRVVILRFGMVLSPDGGALEKMLPAFNFGIGGKIGSGKQHVGWVHLSDAARAVEFALNTPSIKGPVNVVAPEPVTNAEFTKALGKTLDRSTWMAMPGFAAKLVLGEMAKEVLLASAKVTPSKLTQAGFTFKYPEITTALDAAMQHA